MISKHAVRELLRRPREDYSFLKRLSRQKMENHVGALIEGTSFQFKTEPFLHQLTSFYAGACLDNFLFFLDMGLGKSKILLDLMQYKKLTAGVNRTLVLVPSVINLEGWQEEGALHSTLEVVPMFGDSATRWRLLEERGDVFVLTYAGLLYMLCGSKRTKVSKKMSLNTKLVRKFCGYFDAFAADELHNAKSSQSLTHKALEKLSNALLIRYGATATPFGLDPIDLWAQFYVIDRGETLGETLALYRQAMFVQRAGYGGFPKWEFDDRNIKRLHRWLQNRSIRYEDEDCSDLPARTDQVVKVGLSPDAVAHYETVLRGFVVAKGDRQQLQATYAKARQICSGFLQLNGEDSMKEVIPFKDPPKQEALLELVRNMPRGRKMIVWHEFQQSGRLIEAALKKDNVRFVAARGETDTLAAIREFKKNPKCRVLVMNYASGAEGGNFQAANYVVCWDLTDKYIKFRQAMKRCWRTGQTQRVHFYYLLVHWSNSVDLKIKQALDNGKDMFTEVVEGRENFND